ncbi:LON peptidase substrate-binding domain-containing protein [Microbacterium sp. NPDC089987]|uniref:LON peptidase substrate-binding domain-containing protein n=1 Tax=Microbacterium sp. NPDC089987 TaxID=3364202 RepID=UPI00380ED15A
MAATAMFPLETVLFPYTPLALRVFEERYLKMLGAALESHDPSFGVVLIERGSEAGGGDTRFATGTMARIVEVAATERDIELLVVGAERIEVGAWWNDEVYPTAEVHAVPELTWDPMLAPLRDEAEKHVRRVLTRSALTSGSRWDPSIEISDDPLESSWQLAAIAPLGPIDQLELLRATSLAGLLARTIDLTLEAEQILTATFDGGDDNDDPGLTA